MPKRILKGVVVSAKCKNTVSVKVERTVKHPVLKKTVKRSKKYAAHYEIVNDIQFPYQVGDVVVIQESKPISKTKKWIVISKE